MIQIGKDIHIEPSEFKGKTYAAIRRYYEDSNGEMKPGRQGINLKPEEWVEFCEKFDAIRAEIDAKMFIKGEE